MHVDSLRQDIGYALRLFKRAPGFTFTAALIIALGIGPTTTIFSVANSLLYRAPDGVRDPSQLVSVYCSSEGFEWGTCSYPVFRDYREADNGLAAVAALEGFPASLSTQSAAEPEMVTGMATSWDYFTVLGTQPLLGRFFLPDEDDSPNGNPVVVLSHRLWTHRFGADPDVIGSTVSINRFPFTVIGVAEEGFSGHVAAYSVSLWVPIGMRERVLGRDLSDASSGIVGVGRRAPGWPADRVAEAGAVISPRIRASHPEIFADHSIRVVPYSVMIDQARGPVTLFMALMLVVTGLVLLIASVNVGGVMLSRAVARSREVAVRLALGAGRWRLIRQLLTESVLLFSLGGAMGILIVIWATRGLAAIHLPLPVPLTFDFTPDWRVMLFTVAVAFGCGTLFGLAPALGATRQDLVSALKSTRPEAPGRSTRLRSTFVVAQVAGSVVLLVAAGMFLRALSRADSLDLGFDPNGVHVMTIDVSLHHYTSEEGRDFFAQLRERAASLPQVQSAAIASMIPLGFGTVSSMVTLPGREEIPGEGLQRAYFSFASDRYFETLRIPMITGRAFNEADREGTLPVMIVNEAAARAFWPGATALGQQIEWGETRYEVVGVAQSGKHTSIGAAPEPLIYLAFRQHYQSEASLVVRTLPGAPRVDRAVREIALQLDPDLPVQTNAPYSQIIGLSLLPNRIAAGMALGFGALGLILTSVGLFGVLSYTVSQRTREIGIRIALGADAGDVRGLVMRQGVRVTAIGLAIGCLLALAAAQAIRSLLFGVSPADPVSFGSIVLVFSVVGLLASYLPARRATRTDPMVALRQE
jgi:predicted permease